MGIEYMFKRKLKLTNNEVFPQWTLGDELLYGTIPINFAHLSPAAKIQFRNIIYGVIKIPLNPTNIWKVKVGYSRPMGDGEYEGGYYGSVLYEGDMFYGFGVEVYINQSTFLELMFVNYKGGTLGIDGNINKGFNLGIKHTHLSAGFGFTY